MHNSKTDDDWRCSATQPLKWWIEQYTMSTYCVHFVVFVFSIDVFDVRYNVGVQRLGKGRLAFSMATMERTLLNTMLPMCVIIFFTSIYLPEKFVMTSEQFKEELQESGGVNEISIPQKNESFAEGLT